MRHISFRHTAPQLLDRSQTVTRRVGWRFLKPGDLLRAVGRLDGHHGGHGRVGTLAVLRVIDVRREPLSRLNVDARYGEEELPREGFPCWMRREFVDTFRHRHRLSSADVDVTRIAFEYVTDRGSRP